MGGLSAVHRQRGIATPSGVHAEVQEAAAAHKQYSTKTLIPGQPVPSEIRDALQKAMDEIDREDRAMMAGNTSGADEAIREKPFEHAPPSASTDRRALLRQSRMLQRMRKKQSENAARNSLAHMNPEEAANCKRYNLTEKQLRAVRRV